MYTNKEDIAKWLRKYEIANYTINDDLTVDVKGGVHLSTAFMGQSKEEWLEEMAQTDFELCEDGSYVGNGSHYVYEEKTHQVYELPVQFGTVSGEFDVCDNELRTLKGCPHTVGEGFYCENNVLRSLVGAPSRVGQVFRCDENPLNELGDIETQIGGDFIGPHHAAGFLSVKSDHPERTILDRDTFNQAITSLKEKRQLEQAVPKAGVLDPRKQDSAISAITKARAKQGLPPVPPAPQKASPQVAAAPKLKQTPTFKI